MGTRISHTKMTVAQWQSFLAALGDVAKPATIPPRFRDFVRVHVAAMTTAQGMTWQVHTMPNMGMVGRNFLAWHRWFLLQLERQLQRVDATVSIPYWDWITDPNIPTALDGPTFRNTWGITRDWNAQYFVGFQRRLEALHSNVHIAVGGQTGTMAGASSPADPLFWLHHANIDRLWATWQTSPNNANPPNTTTKLQPATGYPVRFGTRVADVLDTTALDYSYK